jgi:serine/threonine-protein kinase
MGVVYEVEHTNTGERLALKLMLLDSDDPAYAARFAREARAYATIQREHVVRVIDSDVAPELGGKPFVVMELLKGADLAAVAKGGPLPPLRVLDYLRQAGIGLERAHAAGIVHRDLKPENLFVHTTPEGRTILKILDFGIARLLDPEVTSVTKRGDAVGTPYYMAPEQARGDISAITRQTDVWVQNACQRDRGSPTFDSVFRIGIHLCLESLSVSEQARAR